MIEQFPITGIRHHDFKDRLDELHKLAPGKRVTLSIEHENVAETDAVICFMGCQHLGYVRSGNDRDRAFGAIEASGRRSIMGRAVSVSPDGRTALVEVEVAEPAVTVKHESDDVLKAWSYDGPMLHEATETVRLHSMTDMLVALIDGGEAWDEDMEACLETIGKEGWRDISLEFRSQLEHCMQGLTGACNTPGYAAAAERMQYIIDYMGSPETRRRQAQWLIDVARSEEMKRIRLSCGDKAVQLAERLPRSSFEMFVNDGEVFMGKLWYLRQPYNVARGVLTLVALNLLLNEGDKEGWLDCIPQEWLMAWARRRGSEADAEVVHRIIADHKLEQTDKPLLDLLDQMHETCRDDHGQRAAEMVCESIRTCPKTEVSVANGGMAQITDKGISNHFYEGSQNVEHIDNQENYLT